MKFLSKRIYLSCILGGLAATSLAPAIALTPEAYEHYQHAVALEQKKDYEAAKQEYRFTIGLDPYDSLTYLKLAHLVEADGQKDEALQLYQKALELNPKDTMIHLSLARVWESKNQPDKALAHYQQLLASNPDYTYAYLSIARLEKTIGKNAEAIQHYQQFLAAYPKHIDAQRELAALLMHEKQYNQAATVYQALKSSNEAKFKDDLAYGISLNNADKPEEALKIFEKITTPSVTLSVQMGMSYEKLNRLPEAYQAYQQAVTLAPEEKNDLNLKLADLAMSINQPDKAINALTAYLKRKPRHGEVRKALADILMQKKDYAAAGRLYQEALKDIPEKETAMRASALQNLGLALQHQKQVDGAIAAYEKALMLDNTQRDTRLNLAIAYHQQGSYDKALALYRKLLSENSDMPTVRKDMGQILLALGDKAFQAQDFKIALAHYQDAYMLGGALEVPALLGLANTQYAMKNAEVAYSTYQRLLEKDPENLTARLNKAQLDLEKKNYLPALENLRWVVEKKPDNMEAYKLLAQTHGGLGDYGQALLYYKKALEFEPKNTTLLMGYGYAWRQIGDLDKALNAYETARAESPDNALIRYNLGSVYNLKNKLEDSVLEYRTAIQLNPSFAESYFGMGTTYEKQKKLTEALEVYKQFLEKAPPTSSYVPIAKSRVQYLQTTLGGTKKPVTAQPSATPYKTPAPTAKTTASP